MAEKLSPTPEEAWQRIGSSEKKAQIVRGVVQTSISMGLTPEEAGDVFSNLDDQTAKEIGYLFGGIADGETVKEVGRKLKSS